MASDYLDPIPPTAIKKWGGGWGCWVRIIVSGEVKREGCGGPKGFRHVERELCVLSACGHCGGDALEVQKEIRSMLCRETCVSAISYTHMNSRH